MDDEPAARTVDPYGPATATFVVVSSMVGSGILTTTGYMLHQIGNGPLILLAWLAGGVLALCGALSLAEIAAALPRSGGEYAILHAAYGRRPAFLAGWVTFLLGFAGPIAASASAAATYALAALGAGTGHTLAVRAIASAMILALAGIHAAGRSHGARLQAAVTVAKLALLAALAVAGIAAGWGRREALTRPPDSGPGAAWFIALVFVSYAYTGWNGAAYIAGEVRQPARNLPRSILAGTALVTAFYLALNVAFVLGLPAEEAHALAALRDDALEPVAELAARNLFGDAWARRLSLGAALVLLGSLSAMVLTGPRVAQAMARDGLFPAAAARLSTRGNAPAAATALLAALALALLWSGSFEWLVLFSGIGLALFSLATVAAVIVLRIRRPDLHRPFRLPLYPLPPLIYLAGTAALVAVAFAERPEESAAAIGAILLGLPVHEWLARRGAKSPADRHPT